MILLRETLASCGSLWGTITGVPHQTMLYVPADIHRQCSDIGQPVPLPFHLHWESCKGVPQQKHLWAPPPPVRGWQQMSCWYRSKLRSVFFSSAMPLPMTPTVPCVTGSRTSASSSLGSQGLGKPVSCIYQPLVAMAAMSMAAISMETVGWSMSLPPDCRGL